MQCIVRKLM